jgi:acyl-CoA reductase-like NAD-dependent aldehyde dehydrogenase
VLLRERHEHFAEQIAREGGKPLQDAIVEVNRELWNFTGREIPMGLTAASAKR